MLSHKAWIYASSSANSGLSLKANLDDWHRISFRPRIFRNVGVIDTRRAILGHTAQLPFYVSPMGTLGSAHDEAEPLLVRGAARKGVHAVISTASTKPADEIARAFADEQKRLGNTSPSRLFFQLYTSLDKERVRGLIHRVKEAGYKGLWMTVDTPLLGKRLADRYLQAEEAFDAGLDEVVKTHGEQNVYAPASGGRSPPGFLDPCLTWDYLKWVRKEWDGPIVLKGIQCVDDVKLAVEHGVQGVLLSNHGGRQIHTAPSSLITLLEIRGYYPEAFQKLEVYVDGGLRDGSDVLKALCLGATAVGVGRPFLYAMAAYGIDGVERCVDSKCAINRFIFEHQKTNS